MDRFDTMPEGEAERQDFFCEAVKKLLEQRAGRLGRKLTCHIDTFGCQMNARDSEKLLGLLQRMGYEVSESENADFVLFNTCTVRDNADQKVYGRLGQLAAGKKKNPDMIISLCGCMMQAGGAVEKIRKSYRQVDIIFGTHNIYRLAELVYRKLTEGGLVAEIWDGPKQIVEELPAVRRYPFKSGVNIMYGCNNFCSYCIVPYVRGRERSRQPEDIIGEIKKLAADGVTEVMLLGQNVNSYGKGLDAETDFPKLLRLVNDIPGIRRVRFMTSHPKDLTDSLIEAMAECGKVCPHLHLPLQSGSSRILKIMNRHYDKETYLSLVEKIRSRIPDISLTTDIIVGFPGETEEDFLETLDVVKKVRYDGAFTFIYSKRTGTPAAAMADQVPADVVKDRFDRLLKEVQRISREESGRYVGREMEVLAEEPDDHTPGYMTGRLANNLLVHFPGQGVSAGDYLNVVLEESKGFYYIGQKVQEG